MDFIRMSPQAQRVLTRAAEESRGMGQGFLGVEHLFMALADDESRTLKQAFAGQTLDVEAFVATLRARVASIKHTPDEELIYTPRCRHVLQLAAKIAARGSLLQVESPHLLEAILQEGCSVPVRLLRARDVDLVGAYHAIKPASLRSQESPTPTLDRFGRDLTAQARLGALSPVIGREHELGLLAEVLLRKSKNNPVLVGEAGVGKTAVVEGLARQLAGDRAPGPLRRSRILELSVSALLAGTKYRGEFEERLLAVAKEASSDPDLILFLDEIHTLVGAGAGANEAMDAAAILKPALARGELRCIGATTLEEYRGHIEKDSALERRFERVLVEEPTLPQAAEILGGLAPSLEEHHGVAITPEALKASLDLTVRYVPGRRLPDKAIDALDQSCARVRLQTYTHAKPAARPQPAEVDPEAIARTVSQWTGIPIERITEQEAGHLLKLEERLNRRVVGQGHAVKAVTHAILTAKAGLADPERPTAVFLFLGPTGVGKTELAKGLAEGLFGDGKRLIRFDMSEYTEAHSVAKMIGSPPGYIGHEREGELIAAVRTHPHCILLFDEIEKAHPQVFDLFLQMFDEGRVTGARGRTADFRHAVIILTSNLDLRPEREEHGAVGFVREGTPQEIRIDPREALTAHLRPELVNRIDEIIVFNQLGQDDLRLIVDRYVRAIEKLAAERGLELNLEDEVYDYLVQLGVSEKFGARELRRVVDRLLRQPLAREMIRRGNKAGRIRVARKGDGLKFVD